MWPWVGPAVSVVLNISWIGLMVPFVVEARRVGHTIAPLAYVTERAKVRAEKRKPIWRMLAVSGGFVLGGVLLDAIVGNVAYGWGVLGAIVAVCLVAFAFDAPDGNACASCGRVAAGIEESREPTKAVVDDEIDNITYTYKIEFACPYCGHHWHGQDSRKFPVGKNDFGDAATTFQHSILAREALERKQKELEKKRAEAEDDD